MFQRHGKAKENGKTIIFTFYYIKISKRVYNILYTTYNTVLKKYFKIANRLKEKRKTIAYGAVKNWYNMIRYNIRTVAIKLDNKLY